MKQTYVHGSHTFLVKVELILPPVWAHPKNLTHKISLSKSYIYGNPSGLGAWAVVPARQMCNVGVELLHTLHKMTNADLFGLLEHVCYVVLLCSAALLGNGEKVEHHAVIKGLAQKSPGSFLGTALEVCIGVTCGLLVDDLVPCIL